MAEVEVTQTTILATVEGGSIEVSQEGVMAAAMFPSPFVDSSQVMVLGVTDMAVVMDASQLQILVAGMGRVNDPAIRAWTYTLDGHDFYILRLGNQETLVFDTVSGEWFTWGSGSSALWRAYTGLNWSGGTRLGAVSSNVVVGDDANGSLYFLDPDFDYDDHPLNSVDEPVEPIPFDRVVTGQVLTPRGYSKFPCFGVELMGSVGQNDSSETDVQLEYSDDRGQSYTDAGTVTLPIDEYDTRVNWRSLGSFRSPGRLFRITDRGALKRIDSLEVSGPDGD